jgi:cytoskeleton protein RodZ
MSSVGAYLRGLREQQGLSVDELSRATRVLHHYLEALESDNMASLPAPVFTKGFIRAYCQALGADPGEALKLYDRSAGRLPERPKVPIVAAPVIVATPDPDDYSPLITQAVGAPQGEPRETRSRGTLLVSFILVVVLGAAFFAVTMTLQSSRDGDGGPSERAVLLEPPPAAEVPAASPVSASVPAENPAPAPAVASPPAVAPPPPATAQPAKPPAAPSVAMSPPAPSTPPASSVPAAPVTPPAPSAASVPATVPAASPAASAANQPARNPAAPYRLIARTTETTWMRVRTEDGRTSEETIPANEIREWISNGPFIITIGNAGGVSLELNGRAIPRLGASGSVITRLVLPSDNQ